MSGKGGRPFLPVEHGTERGYQQHRHRRDLPACQPCREAHAAHETARKADRIDWPYVAAEYQWLTEGGVSHLEALNRLGVTPKTWETHQWRLTKETA